MSRYLILISPAFLSLTSFPVQIARPAKRRRCEYPHMYNKVSILLEHHRGRVKKPPVGKKAASGAVGCYMSVSAYCISMSGYIKGDVVKEVPKRPMLWMYWRRWGSAFILDRISSVRLIPSVRLNSRRCRNSHRAGKVRK